MADMGQTATAPTQNWRAYCYRKLALASRPRDRLTVSGWADKHRWLSSKQSGEAGPWRTSRNPILREIMDALSVHSAVQEIVIMKSSQVGVTELTVNWLGYIVEHAPAPAMVIMPTPERTVSGADGSMGHSELEMAASRKCGAVLNAE